MFFGTSSPIRKLATVAMVIASTTAKAEMVLESNPKLLSQGVRSLDRAGSATKPVSRVVSVMPS